MLKVTIEYHPHGEFAKRSTVVAMDIWNDGTGTNERGNYKYRIDLTKDRHHSRTLLGRVTNFRRNHPDGAAQLVQCVLRQALPFVPENRYLAPAQLPIGPQDTDQDA